MTVYLKQVLANVQNQVNIVTALFIRVNALVVEKQYMQLMNKGGISFERRIYRF